MKGLGLAIATALTLWSVAPAAAAPTAAPFGCDARAPSVCYFRIYYGPRQTRDVRLPGGTKEKIPGVEVGHDRYCVTIGKAPAYKCEQKKINPTYNN